MTRLKWGMLVFSLNVMLAGPVSAQYSDVELMAVYMNKFTAYIDWPSSPQIVDSLPAFTIGIIGDHPFGQLLDNMYQGVEIKSRSVEFKYFKNLDELSPCHLLFISKSEKNQLNEILNQARQYPALTLAESIAFAKEGVMIAFFLDENRLRFAINETAVHNSGFYIRFHLLRRAKIINPLHSIDEGAPR